MWQASSKVKLRYRWHDISDVQQKNLTGEIFGARGHFVSTVGLDEEMVQAYIRNQEQEDVPYDK
jgi:hypothetical protein